MIARRGLQRQGRQKGRLVAVIKLADRHSRCLRNQAPELPVVFLAVRKQNELVRRVEFDQPADAPALRQTLSPAPQFKESLDKMLSEFGIMEALGFLHRQERKALHEGPGKETDPFFDRAARFPGKPRPAPCHRRESGF